MAVKETTTTYRWGDDQIITRVDVRESARGAVAYLYANPDEPRRQQRLDIRAALRLKGWGTLSDHRGGEFVLRVNGLRDGNELLTMLMRDGFVQGNPTVSRSAAAEEKPQGLWDSIKTHSLRASGILYSIGNAIYLASGLLRSKEKGKTDFGQINSALIWGGGDILVAAVGGRDDNRQFTTLLTKLKHHYEREGIEIPKNAAIHVETSTKNKTLGDKIYDFLHEYVNPIKCFSEVAAAVNYFKAGADQGNVGKQITAVIFGIGFGLAGLIPERKIDEEKYAQAGSLGRLWMKIQSNPLALGGFSGYSNTILTSYSAFDEGRRFRNPGKYPAKIHKKTGEVIQPSKYYQLDYAAPGVMFFGNSLYAMSKKNTGGDIKTQEMVSDVYSIAAQILNKQPDDVRDMALESTARFLGERPEIKDTHQQIIERLRAEINIQRQNPWFERVGLAPYQPKPKHVHAASAPEPEGQTHGATNDNLEAANDLPHPVIHAEGLEHAHHEAALPAHSV